MKTKAYFMKNFPPIWAISLFCFLVFGSYFFDLILQSFFFAPKPDLFILKPLRTGIICIGAFIWGVWRVVLFYPYPSGQYGKWLTLTPWRYGMQMPKGSIQLNILDIVIAAILCATILLDKEIPVIIPAIIFLYSYIVSAVISTMNGISLKKYYGKRFLILTIIPFAFYPFPSIISTLISLGLAYLLCYSHLRDVLKAYPWNQISWLEYDEDIFLQKDFKNIKTGWPYNSLAPCEKEPFFIKNKTFTTLMLSVLIVWWLHGLLPLAFDDNEVSAIMLSFILGYLALFLIIARMILYLNGTAPPISFLGRIMNAYFIIPRYDKVFIAPIFIIVFVIFTIYYMPESAQYACWAFEAAVFVLLCAAMGCPPNLSQWRNTSMIRIKRSKMMENKLKQAQGAGIHKPIGEFFTSK